MGNWVEKARKWSKEDGIRGKSIALIVVLLAHPAVQAIITIVGPILISILYTENGLSLKNMLIFAFYVIIVIAVAQINKYNISKINDVLLFLSENEQLCAVFHAMSVKNLELTKLLLDNSARKNFTISSIRRIVSIQKAGFAVCEAIYNLLSSDNKEANFYITLFQKSSSDSGDICQMIAYATSRHEEPVTYKTPYSLRNHDGTYNNVYYHNQIFNNESNEIKVLPTPESVHAHFKKHTANEYRENKIAQYIGIPVVIMGSGTVLLLQLDTDKEFCFGKTEEEIIERVKNLILPFVKALELFYENDRLVAAMHSIDGRN